MTNYVVAMVICVFGVSAHASVQSYRLSQLSPSSVDCELQLQVIEDHFKRATQASVLSVGCETNPGGSFDGVISFSHPSALNPISTYNEFEVIHGRFDTKDVCLERLADEVNAFRLATGLDPVSAYCFKDYHNLSQDSSWTLRLDAFGSPKAKPYSLSRYVFMSMEDGIESGEQLIRDAVAAQGGTYPDALLQVRKGRLGLKITYYAAEKLPLVEYDQAFFSTRKQCEDYREHVEEIFSRAGGRSALTVCGVGSEFGRPRMYALGMITEPLLSEVSSPAFASFEACEAQRDVVQARWRQSLGRNTVGSVCAMGSAGVGDRQVEMRLFWIE